MSWLRMSEVAERLGATLYGADAALEGINTDTRKPDSSALFFALKGPNFDAHDALEKAPADVAAGLVVSRRIAHPAPQILVPDTRLALGALASRCRADFDGRLVALTGSNGKTTVKQMLAAICSQRAQTLATRGNLNNDIGVPLTLLGLRSHHRLAVIEMGANHAGEIAYLTALAQPDVALLNNAGAAHLEGFGSLRGVAEAKGEIFSGLRAGGVAVINVDDAFGPYWLGLNTARRVIRFGRTAAADVRLLEDAPLRLDIAGETVEIELPLLGAHNAMNAAAACAVALALEIDSAAMRAGLESMEAAPGRLGMKSGVAGARVIDDTYNANPGSMRAAIDTLAAQSGERILVLGEMGELGDDAAELHAQLGDYAREKNIDRLFACGPLCAASVKRFGSRGQHFANHADLIEALKPLLNESTVVLVKGSRSARMEHVVEGLCSPGGIHAA